MTPACPAGPAQEPPADLIEPADLRDVLALLLTQPGSAVLLDLDGTLIDSEPASVAAFRAFFAHRGWTVSDETIQLFIGRRAPDVFRELEGPWTGLDASELSRESLTFVDHDAYPPLPLPGAVDALTRHHGRAAVVTSAPRDWATRALGIIGAPRPAALLAADSYSQGKPDPAPYRAGLTALDAEPLHTVAFDDAPAGVASARAAGVGLVVGVTTHVPARDLLAAGAHVAAADLTVLP